MVFVVAITYESLVCVLQSDLIWLYTITVTDYPIHI